MSKKRDFQPSQYFSEQQFTGSDFSKGFENGEYESCVFRNVSFSKIKLSFSVFINCEFRDCDFRECNISGTVLRNARFVNCILEGLQFSGCSQMIVSFTFIKCRLSMSSFFGMKIPKTEFTKCELAETDFGSCDLTGSIFDECDLRNALFDKTNLSKCDFRTAFNYVIDPEQNKITKAKFSSTGLPGLLTKYDIEIDT